MKQVTLGSTGIMVPQNGFGALPIQRISEEDASKLLKMAYEGGMRFFDTANAYTDSEKKMGLAFKDLMGERENFYIATKTMVSDPETAKKNLDNSLKMLGTDYVDIYQFHCVNQVYAPGDGTGMYEFMQEAKAEGKIRHIGVTAHKIGVAFDLVNSGLYETLQYPFSYLASDREKELVALCKEKNIGFIAMKGLAGGLLTNSRACQAFMMQYDNVIPIWGIQRESELKEFLSYMDNPPAMDEEISAFIEKERNELSGDFCRACGYCMPCPQGIMINQCARMSQLLRRMPSESWLSPTYQEEMKKIESCTECKACTKKCPYSLDTPNLLKKNYEDYKKVLSGEVTV